MGRLVLNPSGAWLCSSERFRSCQGVCHGCMPRSSRLDRWLLHCGALGVLSQQLRACGKIMALRERQGCQSGGHASGLTIQLSQGQGRQPRGPQGAPPARGRAALTSCGVLVCAWHRTSGRRGCQPFFAFFRSPSVAGPCGDAKSLTGRWVTAA